jgi:nucleotide-binding universal stress UspA family protein
MSDILRTILVPHDLSKYANRALRIAATLAGPDGRLIVVHVTNEYGNPALLAKVRDAGRRDLARAVRAALGSKPAIPVEQRVVAGNPYREIMKAAKRADCIVMCTLGRTGLAHFVIGSVTEKVVRHAPTPVLTFRPDVVRGRSIFGGTGHNDRT